MRNEIIPYRKDLKAKARELRKNSTLSEVLLWQELRKRQFNVQFHRQVPFLNYIVDFYCHELKLAIEINGNSHEWKVSYDHQRIGKLRAEGVEVLVFDDLDVKNNIKWVLNEIYRKIHGEKL
ncbi:endonuclease domain-containing protein [Ekhidna sp.]|uniref:endonuclease domain-containing protein n=1 Tax=Ekhidna sp. TaxID=2608089 RepID=UPI003B5CCED4